jgi:two-component system chemotaxis sensor kinase CheA
VSLAEAMTAAVDADPAAPPMLVLIQADGRRVALEVTQLVGQQQVVVKNLEANYRRVPGVSGATIMGDGSVALILDVATLVRGAHEAASSPAAAGRQRVMGTAVSAPPLSLTA